MRNRFYLLSLRMLLRMVRFVNETKAPGLPSRGSKLTGKRPTNLFLDAKTTKKATEIAATRYKVSLSTMTGALYRREIESAKGLLKARGTFLATG